MRKRKQRADRERSLENPSIHTSDLFSIDDSDTSNDTQAERSCDDKDEDEYYHLCSRDFNPGTRQNRFTYPHLCQIIDRFSISDIAGCAIANAVLQDLELLEP